MNSLTGLLLLKQICIILLSATLCATAGSLKYNITEKDVFEAYQKIIDQRLKLDTKPTTESPSTEFSYLQALYEGLKNLSEAINHDVHRHVAKKLNPSSSTEVFSKAGKSTSADAYTKIVSSTTPDYSTDRHSTHTSSKVVSSTTPTYPRDKHSTEASTTTPCSTSTTDASAKSTSTTAGYSEFEHPLGSSKTKKCIEDVQSTSQPPSATSRPPSLVGSISGIPGVHFPDYTDIPITSFTCSDRSYIPGFYADLETGCQVFHVCWQNRRESFLCPLGTTFNQALLACDYWYSTNCSLTPHYYNVNAEGSQHKQSSKSQSSMIDVLLEKSDSSPDISKSTLTPEVVLSAVSKFLPVKAKVEIYPGTHGKRAKIVASASVGNEADVQKSYRKKDEPKPLESQLPEKKLEKTVASTSEGNEDMAHKTYQKKDEPKSSKIQPEQKIPTSKPEMWMVKKFQEDAALAVRVMLIGKLAEKLGYAIAKNGTVVTDKSHEAFKLPTLAERLKVLDYDLKSVESAFERLYSRITEGIKRLQDFGTPSYVSSLFTQKPKFVQEPETTHKPEPVKIHKPRVLTQLNPRFIVKPVSLPKEKDDKQVKMPTGEESRKRAVHAKYSVVSTPYAGKSISPETKRALAENYARFMKLRKLS